MEDVSESGGRLGDGELSLSHTDPNTGNNIGHYEQEQECEEGKVMSTTTTTTAHSEPDIEAALQRQLAALTSEYYVNETGGDGCNMNNQETENSVVSNSVGIDTAIVADGEKAQCQADSETATNLKLTASTATRNEELNPVEVSEANTVNMNSSSNNSNVSGRRLVKDRHTCSILEEFGLITSEPKRGRPRKYPPGTKRPKHSAYKIHLNKTSMDRFRDMKERVGNQFKTDRAFLSFLMDKEDERMSTTANKIVEEETEIATRRHKLECKYRQSNRRYCDCLKMTTSFLNTGEVTIAVAIEQLKQLIDLSRSGRYRDNEALVENMLKLESEHQAAPTRVERGMVTDENTQSKKTIPSTDDVKVGGIPSSAAAARDKALELLSDLKQHTQYLVCESQKVLRITNQNNLGLDMTVQPLLVPTDAFVALLVGNKAIDKSSPSSFSPCMSVIPSSTPLKKRPTTDQSVFKLGRGRGQSILPKTQSHLTKQQKENMSVCNSNKRCPTPAGNVRVKSDTVDASADITVEVVSVVQRDQCSQCNLIDVERLLKMLNSCEQPTVDPVILTDVSALERNSSRGEEDDGVGFTSDSSDNPKISKEEDPDFNINEFLTEQSTDSDEEDSMFDFDMMNSSDLDNSEFRLKQVSFQKPLLDHDNINCTTCPVLPERQKPKCPVCDQLFKSRKALQKHVSTEHPEHRLKNYLCHICGRDFQGYSSIRNHILGHSDIRSEMCEVCGVLFRLPVQLHQHVQTVHAKIRPHRCMQEGCTKEFSTKNGLRKHHLTHTDVKNVSCPWAGCGRLFRRQVHLKVHMLLHTNQFPLKCQQCDYKCRQRNALNWHMKSKHGGGVGASKAQTPRRKKQRLSRPGSHGIDEEMEKSSSPLDDTLDPSHSDPSEHMTEASNTKPLLCSEPLPPHNPAGGFDNTVSTSQEAHQHHNNTHQQQQQQQPTPNQPQPHPSQQQHVPPNQRPDMLLPGQPQDSVHSSWFISNQRENDHFAPAPVIPNTDPHYSHGPVLNPDWQWNWTQSGHDFSGYIPRFNYYHSN